MSICKECIHYEICDRYVAPNESFPEVEGGCKCFKDKSDVVEVADMLAYCKKCADSVQGLADKILKKIGHGEDEISALGGCAYFLQQARLYRFDIPNIIKCLIKESENGT